MTRAPRDSTAPSRLGGNDVAGLCVLAVAAAIVGLRLWTSFCFFPLPEWNLVRLAPTFMLRAGISPYAGLDDGPLSTWIYGPVPLLINVPSTLASDATSATLAAGAINLLCTVLPLAIAVSLAVKPRPIRTDLAWVLMLAVALWPNSALHYFQADNVALSFAILSNLVLERAKNGSRSHLVVGGLLASLAAWSKQPLIAVALAQAIWLCCTAPAAAALRYAGIVTAWLLVLATMFTAWFGFDALWLNLVVVPNRIPLCPDLVERTLLFWPHVLLGVVLPLVGTIAWRRHVWRRSSEWLLPALAWLCMLPLGIAAMYKAGGASNSLHGYLFLVVPAASCLVSRLTQLGLLAHVVNAAIILGVTFQQMAATPRLPLTPVTAHLEQAERLAAALPHGIYFPWHPLATWFSERRFYHAEDGLYTRALVGLTRKNARRELPERWSVTAMPGWRENGAFRQLQPTDFERAYYGRWTLHTWLQPDRTTQAAPVGRLSEHE